MNNAKRLEQLTEPSDDLEVLVENHEIETGKPYIHCEVNMILDECNPIWSFTEQLAQLVRKALEMSQDDLNHEREQISKEPQ